MCVVKLIESRVLLYIFAHICISDLSKILYPRRLQIYMITFCYMRYHRQDDGFKVFYHYEEGRDIWAQVGTEQWEEREEEGSCEEGK